MVAKVATAASDVFNKSSVPVIGRAVGQDVSTAPFSCQANMENVRERGTDAVVVPKKNRTKQTLDSQEVE